MFSQSNNQNITKLLLCNSHFIKMIMIIYAALHLSILLLLLVPFLILKRKQSFYLYIIYIISQGGIKLAIGFLKCSKYGTLVAESKHVITCTKISNISEE